MAMSVNVSVEAAAENQIQEVHLDGKEVYVQPLSMSENLSRLTHKIDFSKDESGEKGKPTSEGEKDEEEAATAFQQSTWVWESVHSKVKAALTEVSVLLDVMNIAKEKHYMVLDPVQQEPVEGKVGLTLQSKKAGLQAAGTILQQGAERLRKYHSEVGNRRQLSEFHHELVKLRQEWRLRRVGNMILGDLSYKTAGSRFWAGGTFEVTKSEDETPLLESPGAPLRSTLQVSVPSELEGIAYIQVSIRRLSDGAHMNSVDLSIQNSFGGPVPQDSHWKAKLDSAQNVIFCKEVFAQLSREATQLNSAVPHLVVSNQIFSQLLPGFQLCIALCHQTDKDKQVPSSQPKHEHNHVLEHSLHQLLRTLHYKNLHHSLPHPTTALVGMSKRRRLAGPQGTTTDNLIAMTSSETLLEQIIKQAKHCLLYHRVLKLVDTMAQSIQDPQLAVHWANVSCATEASVKIIITASNYENVRTPVVLHIGVDSVKAVCRDGRALYLSYEEQEIRDLLLSQIAWHHISCIQYICKMIGWQILSLNLHTGTGNVEPLGNASSVMLASPCSTKVISIRAGPLTGPEVFVQSTPRQDETSSVITDTKWKYVGAEFRKVNLNQMPGRNFVNKVELLMASLIQQHPAT